MQIIKKINIISFFLYPLYTTKTQQLNIMSVKQKMYVFFLCVLTGPNALIRTSLTSNHPLNDKTSNNANIASPILSKLKRRGFALKKSN